jgi:hypothetical protein
VQIGGRGQSWQSGKHPNGAEKVALSLIGQSMLPIRRI